MGRQERRRREREQARAGGRGVGGDARRTTRTTWNCPRCRRSVVFAGEPDEEAWCACGALLRIRPDGDLNAMAGARPVCDFCTGPAPVWTYETETIVASTPLPDEPDHVQDPFWGACEPCHQLIQRDDWVGLTQRSVTSQHGTASKVLDARARAYVFDALHRLHLKVRDGLKSRTPRHVADVQA